MALSEKTKTVLERSLIRDKDDLYPDRAATPTSDGVYPIRDTGATVWRHGDEVPTTTKDMSSLYMWEHGDEVYGSHAKDNVVMERYRRDINKAYGKQSQYKDLYVDTFGPKLVSEQLKELK